jgi:hypothetical protein
LREFRPEYREQSIAASCEYLLVGGGILGRDAREVNRKQQTRMSPLFAVFERWKRRAGCPVNSWYA